MAVSRTLNRRTVSLYKLFLRYLAVFCLTTILFAGVVILCASAGFQSGFVLQANYAGKRETGSPGVSPLTGR